MSDQESDAINMPPPKKAKIVLEETLETEEVMEPVEEDFLQVDQSSIDFTEDLTETNGGFPFLGSKYENYVNPEEVERLKEFQVLDEVKSNDEDSEEESNSSDGKSEGLPEEEIERMLDEDLPEGFKAAPKPKEKPYITREKIVLEEKGINHFEMLPLDWMMVRHYSGMPVYMHRATRVCTLSKPYLLGKGNTRRHDIPISSIPCLNYRKALEEEAKQKAIDIRIAEQIRDGSWQKNKTIAPSNKLVAINTDQVPIGFNNEIEITIPSCEKNREIDVQTGDTFDRSLVDMVVISKDIPLQNGQIEVEILGNLKSTQNAETEHVRCGAGNPVDVEVGVKVLEDVAKPKCPFVPKQDDRELPDSRDVSEQNTPDAEDQNGQTRPIAHEAVEAQLTCFAKAENAPNSEVNTEQNPPDDPEEETPLNAQPVVLPGGIVMPPPRVETVNTSWKTQQLSHEQINAYCKKLFKFKTVHIMHFKRWADRRKYAKARKTLQYPTLPEGTKLITIPAQSGTGTENGGLLGAGEGGKASKRDWVMNMNGRSYLSVFHEYVRRALHNNPVYEFKQLENASTPYQATVYIGGMQYGVGRGTSKRLAKANAARASIQILIPEMKDEGPPAENGEPDFSFFDCVGIEDPRITEFCAATCEPSPHATLRTCLLRNFGASDRHINTEMKKLEYQKIELTMQVGKHTATVVCKNKKTAKQRASQAILQALHPHVRSWGSLLRLYGSRSVKSCKERKLEEQQITLLQDQARRNEPNHAVLDKLRHEMRRLRERDGAVVPIGTLMLREDLPTHSGSNLNNVDL